MFWLRLGYYGFVVVMALTGIFNTLSVREHNGVLANVRQRLRNVETPVLPRIRERLMRSDGTPAECDGCERCNALTPEEVRQLRGIIDDHERRLRAISDRTSIYPGVPDQIMHIHNRLNEHLQRLNALESEGVP
jgi:hypothetical protein